MNTNASTYCARAYVFRSSLSVLRQLSAKAEPSFFLTEDNRKFLKNVDTLLFDCDGVIWRGSHLIPGASKALSTFRKEGKQLLFVSNNSSKSRDSYIQKFQGLGIHGVECEDVISSSYAVAAYLRTIGFKKKVFLVGNKGLEDELQKAGISYIGGETGEGMFPGTQNGGNPLGDLESILALQVDEDVGAVVVGWDPKFDYSKIVYASVCLREIPGCLFIASNTDNADSLGPPLLQAGHPSYSRQQDEQPTDNAPAGISGSAGDTMGNLKTCTSLRSSPPSRFQSRMMPGTGSLVAAVAVASGVQPFVVGKEGPWLLSHLRQEFGMDPSRSCMIGDRLDTDIAMGRAGGLKTVLTLSGVATWQEAKEAAERGEGPDVVVPSIAELAGVACSDSSVPHDVT
jgi:phosphoglycolate phosphatase